MIRQAILQAHNYTCFYTGAQLPADQLQIDHIVPVAAGGENTVYNMVPCRKEINHAKRDAVLKDSSVLLDLNRPFAEKALKLSAGYSPRKRAHKAISIQFSKDDYERLELAAKISHRMKTSLIKMAINMQVESIIAGAKSDAD